MRVPPVFRQGQRANFWRRVGPEHLKPLIKVAMEKHELSKIDFEIIENAFNALLQSRPDPIATDSVADLRNIFRDAYTGWLEIKKEAA
jgi:hypothetical protein